MAVAFLFFLACLILPKFHLFESFVKVTCRVHTLIAQLIPFYIIRACSFHILGQLSNVFVCDL